MSNTYLEKIALTALARNAGRGLLKSVTGLDRAGNRMASSSLNKAVTGATETGVIRNPAMRMRQMPSGLRYNSTAANPARAVQSTDVLARTNVRDRLAARRVAKAAAPAAPAAAVAAPATATNTMAQMKMRTNQLVGRAKQLAVDHPKAAIGGGAAGLAAAGYVAGKRDNEPTY